MTNQRVAPMGLEMSSLYRDSQNSREVPHWYFHEKLRQFEIVKMNPHVRQLLSAAFIHI